MGRRWYGKKESGTARATRTVLAAVLVAGLTPWNGVALADEFSGDSSGGVAVQAADGATLYGSAETSNSTDQNGYPIYDENGNWVSDTWNAGISKADFSGDTLRIPKSFDIVARSDKDETESLISGITPVTLEFYRHAAYQDGLNNVKHIVIEDASQLTRLSFNSLPSLESIEILNGASEMRLSASSCDKLKSITFEGGSVKALSISKCPSLTLQGISSNVFGTLTSLSLTSYPGEVNFDGSSFLNLEYLSISDSDLRSYLLSPCSKLVQVDFDNCGLTSVDLDAIPNWVKQFYCRYNKIIDTSAITERFGEYSADSQFYYPYGNQGDLVVISNEVANGYLKAGSLTRLQLSGKYRPSSNGYNYYREDYTRKNASSNFSVESDNPSVLSCEVTQDSTGSQDAYLGLEAKAAGKATVKAHYHFEGEYATYDDTQVVEVEVSAQDNHITAIQSVDSLSFDAASDCAICDSLGVKHQESSYRSYADIVFNAADPTRSITMGEYANVTSSDDEIVSAELSCGMGASHGNLLLKIGKPGDAVLKISALSNGNPTGVEKTVSVHVGEQPKLILNVSPEATVVSDGGSGYAFGSYSCGSDFSIPSFAYYEDNGAIEALNRVHNDLRDGSCSTNVPSPVNFVTFTSDNESVISFSGNDGRYFVNGVGTANVTIQDIWGNKGICKVTVKSVSDAVSKLGLPKAGCTVELGNQIDLKQFVSGYDALTDAERNAIGALAFISGDNSIAVFRCDTDPYGAGLALGATSMAARAVGDVTVKLCYSDSYFDSRMYYGGTWKPIEIGSMTVHVVEPGKPDQPGEPVAKTKVAVPSAAALTYTGSEQTGVAGTADYTVSGGKATAAGSYTAKLSLKDKKGSVWASTGTSNDISVKWSISAAPMSKVEVSGLDGAHPYTGKAIEPDVKCKFNGKTLAKGKDYTLSYSNNVKVGNAKVTITGKGNFAGKVDKTFTIGKNPGKWVSSSKGWRYDNGDGTYLKSCWKIIDGKTYRFNASGYMVTGWQQINNTWYYFESSGAMATGWKSLGGAWYWFDGSGAMATGWFQAGGSWYYANGSGAMQAGWKSLGGKWYYLDGSGAMATGWKSLGGAWYWFDGSGAMATGWFQAGGSWYYANGSGAMVSSRWVGNYYLGGSGAMVTNAFTPDGYYCGPNGAWQYIYWTPNGKAYHKTKGCATLNNSTNIKSGTLSGAGNRTACKVCWH